MSKSKNPKDQIRFLKKGDDPFKVDEFDAFSPVHANLDFLSNIDPDDSILASVYKDTADMIVDQLALGKIKPMKSNIYFMPICYLYWHCLELQLKSMIKICQSTYLIEDSEGLQEMLKGHELYTLWNKLKPSLLELWPKGDKIILAAIESTI